MILEGKKILKTSKIISQYLYFIFRNIQPVIKGLWQFGSHLLTYNKNIIGIYKNNRVHS